MKQKLLLLLLVLSTIKLEAQIFNDGILEYTVTSNINNYVSVGIYNNTCPTGELTIPETIVDSGVTYTIRSLAHYAFSGCSGLTNINLPNSLVSIGNSTFYECSSLTNIDLSNTNVTIIGDTNFYNCTNLTSISFPSVTLSNIGYRNFNNCVNVTDIKANWITPPSSINSGLFENINNENNIELTVPKGSKSEYKRAEVWSGFEIIREKGLFFNDGTFEYLVTDETNNYVSINKYNNVCVSGEITIPEMVTHSGITYSITSIGDDAFYDCQSLTSINIPNTVTIIRDAAFGRCYGLMGITIPDSVITIEDFAFITSGLTNVIIPDYVTFIGVSAFYFCYELTSVTLGASVTVLEDNVFNNCLNLDSVNIPNSVTSIGEKAFRNCRGLTQVTVNWSTPLAINPNTFEYTSIENIPLFVPPGTKSTYQSASVWQDFDIQTLNTSVFNKVVEIHIYPNPVNNILYINLENAAELRSIKLYNIHGQLLKQDIRREINVSAFTTGIYLLEITTDKGKATKKIVIE